MQSIRHIWFDLAGTLTEQPAAFHQAHDHLRYQTYAQATGRVLTPSLEREFDAQYTQLGSNSAVFTALGLPSDYWMQASDKLDETDFYTASSQPADTLKHLHKKLQISLFTNYRPNKISRLLQAINVNEDWFSHILSGDDVTERKPALAGFYRLIELSAESPEHILYVGDRVNVDIVPAKQLGLRTALLGDESVEADYCLKSIEDLLPLTS